MIIDEIHRYPNWAREIKNIYDKHPQLKLIISGSSNISIIQQKHDLSRRAVTYSLVGLSFNEFLSLESESEFSTYSLREILENPLAISQDIKKIISHK